MLPRRALAAALWALCLAGGRAFRAPLLLRPPHSHTQGHGGAAVTMQLAPRPRTGWTSAPPPAGTVGEATASTPMTLNLRKFALEQPAPSVAELTGQSRIFLDSAKVEDFASLLPLGIVWGVTVRSPIPLDDRAARPHYILKVHSSADQPDDSPARGRAVHAQGHS